MPSTQCRSRYYSVSIELPLKHKCDTSSFFSSHHGASGTARTTRDAVGPRGAHRARRSPCRKGVHRTRAIPAVTSLVPGPWFRAVECCVLVPRRVRSQSGLGNLHHARPSCATAPSSGALFLLLPSALLCPFSASKYPPHLTAAGLPHTSASLIPLPTILFFTQHKAPPGNKQAPCLCPPCTWRRQKPHAHLRHWSRTLVCRPCSRRGRSLLQRMVCLRREHSNSALPAKHWTGPALPQRAFCETQGQTSSRSQCPDLLKNGASHNSRSETPIIPAPLPSLFLFTPPCSLVSIRRPPEIPCPTSHPNSRPWPA